jgi:hypothetical protein
MESRRLSSTSKRVAVQGQGFSGEAVRAAVDEAGYEVVGA